MEKETVKETFQVEDFESKRIGRVREILDGVIKKYSFMPIWLKLFRYEAYSKEIDFRQKLSEDIAKELDTEEDVERFNEERFREFFEKRIYEFERQIRFQYQTARIKPLIENLSKEFSQEFNDCLIGEKSAFDNFFQKLLSKYRGTVSKKEVAQSATVERILRNFLEKNKNREKNN